MKSWLVGLDCDTFDLEQLAMLYHMPRYSIYTEQNNYYLRSSEFDKCDTYELVLAAAKDIVECINGAVGLLFPDIGLVKIGNIVELQQDGSRSIYLRPLAASMRARTNIAELIITDTNGNIVAPIEHTPLETVMDAAEQSQAVKDALRFHRIGDWYSLYKVYEIILDDVKNLKVIDTWITKDTRSRFTGTAQSQDALGDQARHARKKYRSPSHPMALSEARQVIDKILRIWLKIT